MVVINLIFLLFFVSFNFRLLVNKLFAAAAVLQSAEEETNHSVELYSDELNSGETFSQGCDR